MYGCKPCRYVKQGIDFTYNTFVFKTSLIIGKRDQFQLIRYQARLQMCTRLHRPTAKNLIIVQKCISQLDDRHLHVCYRQQIYFCIQLTVYFTTIYTPYVMADQILFKLFTISKKSFKTTVSKLIVMDFVHI